MSVRTTVVDGALGRQGYVARTMQGRRDQVDGVDIRWIDAPAPFTATLMFRVGPTDERLKTAGITHLVEHLALAGHRRPHHAFNGEVHPSHTAFWASGSPAEATDFIGSVCRSLSDLDMARLEPEARVLAAESATRPAPLYAEMLGVWFGPNGPGLLGGREYGLDWVGPSHVGSWASRHFTAGNALLTLTGPPPSDLRLALPQGQRHVPEMPPPDVGFRPESLVKLRSEPNGVSLGTVAARSSALMMGVDILGHRLRQRLRHEMAMVYSVTVRYQPLSARDAFIYLASECLPENAEEVSRAFLETLTELHTNGPTSEEMEDARRFPGNGSLDPAAVARNELNRLGLDELAGYRVISLDEALHERLGITPAQVQEALADALSRGLVTAAPGFMEGLDPRPRRSQPVLPGRRYRAKPFTRSSIRKVIVGDEGISAFSDGRWVSIAYTDLALVTRPSADARKLCARQGGWIEISSRGWWQGSDLIRRLDERVPPEVVIPHRRNGV